MLRRLSRVIIWVALFNGPYLKGLTDKVTKIYFLYNFMNVAFMKLKDIFHMGVKKHLKLVSKKKKKKKKTLKPMRSLIVRYLKYSYCSGKGLFTYILVLELPSVIHA